MKIFKNQSTETEKSDKSPLSLKKNNISSNNNNNEQFPIFLAETSSPCHNNCCKTYFEKKIIPKPFEEPQYQKSKAITNDRDYIFILIRLVQECIGKTLNIQIQDIVYFEKGEPQAIIQSIKDGIDRPYQLRVQQWKGSLQKLMQYMNNRRKKAATTNLLQENNLSMEKQISNGYSKELGNNNISEKSKDAVLIKYEDNTSQILCEAEFFQMMSRRRGDRFWQKIFYIQNYIKSKSISTHRVHFIRSRDINNKYFERSAMETRILRGEVISASTEYISQVIEDDFLRQLKENNISEYLRYITFKIIHYLDILDDTIINEGYFEWNQDERGDFQFHNAFKLIYEKREEQNLYTQPKEKQVKNIQNKDESGEEDEYIDPKRMFNRKYQLKQMALNAKKKLQLKQQHIIYKDGIKVSEWQKYMEEDYNKLLQSVGIDKDQFNVKEDNQSELTFKQLHPELTIEFQKVMKDQSLFNKLKKQLFSDNNKSNPISQSKMLNSYFLTPDKKNRSITVQKNTRQDLISTLNQSSIKKSIRSVDRTVSEFRYDSRNGKRSTKTLSKILGLVNV